MDFGKMVSTKNAFEREKFVSEEECKKDFCSEVDVSSEYQLYFDEITHYTNESLCILREYREQEDIFEYGQTYLAIFDLDNNLVSYSVIDLNFSSIHEQISAFKETQGL